MARKYIWIAYTVADDDITAKVHDVGNSQKDLADLVGFYIEGPVPADMYKVGTVFKLIENDGRIGRMPA